MITVSVVLTKSDSRKLIFHVNTSKLKIDQTYMENKRLSDTGEKTIQWLWNELNKIAILEGVMYEEYNEEANTEQSAIRYVLLTYESLEWKNIY